VHTLCFIRRARALGFHVGEIRALLNLWQDRDRPAEEVQRLAARHAKQIRTRITVLQAMLLALRQLTEGCSTGDRPHCPILEEAGCGSDAQRQSSMTKQSGRL
jgi:MerR family copper efflux transcriptional regulator